MQLFASLFLVARLFSRDHRQQLGAVRDIECQQLLDFQRAKPGGAGAFFCDVAVALFDSLENLAGLFFVWFHAHQAAHCAALRKSFLAHCAFFFLVGGMDFVTEIKARPVAELVAAIGAPERTIYSWKMGERLPPDWVQRLVLKALKKRSPTKQ